MTIPPHSLAAIRQPAFMLDDTGRIAAANDLAEGLAGRPLAGLSAPEAGRALSCRRADGTPLAPAELPSCRALRGEEVIEEPLVATAADGRTLDVLATASPIRVGDAIIGALVIWQNVSGRVRAEEALHESERRHAFLVALGDRLRDLVSADEVLAVASEMVGRHLDANGVVFCEIDAVGESARVRADWADGTVPGAAGRYRMDDFGVGDLYRQGHVRRTEDVAAERGEAGIDGHRALGTRASLGVPICRGGRLAAVLAVHSAAPRRWTDAEVELVREAGDRILASVERARAEEALRESEERLRLAQENAQIGIWDRDVATDTVTMPPEFLRHYGLEHLVVSRYADLVPLMHPDDRALVEAARTGAFAAGEHLNIELRVMAPDGDYRWIQFKGRGVRDDRAALVRVIGLLIDITDRKRVEEALRESEERLRDVLDLSLDAVYRTDLDAGRFDYISPINEALTGFSAEEFGRFGLDEFMGRIHVEDQPRIKMVVAEAMRGDCTRTSGTVEYRFRHRDGTWRWLSDHFAFQLGDDGRPRYRVGVVRDVTRRHEIEAALRSSEERVRLAQEGARIGTWDWEASTGMVTISPNFLALYGLERLGISDYADLEHMIHPDDLKQVWEAQLAVVASGTPMDLELRAILPTGEIRWVQFKGQGITDELGALARVIGVLIDVTDRKRAEEALAESEADARSFFRNMVDPCAICETVLDGGGDPSDIRLVEVNPAFARALSLAPEQIVGQTAFMILPALAREWFDLFRRVSRDRVFIEVEEPFPALDRWYHVTGFPVRHGRVAVVFRDVTGQREAEDERARFTAELQRSNEELQRFAYVASHDLQEPLRSIVSFSQLLERRYRGQLGEDADEYIGFIVEGGNRMQRLIGDLLLLSRVETQAKPPAPTDAGEVVAGVVRSMDAALREAGATVEVDGLPTVMADADQIGQVFSNLVANAIKYCRPGTPPEISISAERAGRLWRFAVSDNGIGIEPEHFGRIFEMFGRLHSHDEYDGTGIGLAVVKRIVDRHGGRVWLDSTPGLGSTFYFTLPAA